MAVFRVQVNYVLGTKGKWSNVWHLTAPSLLLATGACVEVMEDPLRSILSNVANLKSFLVSEEGTSAFATLDRNMAGTNGDSGSLLPLFNSVKVLFPASDFGRPDLKYMKGFVGENTQSGGTLDSGAITAVATVMNSLLTAMQTNGTPLGSKTGVDYVSANVQPDVQMRQLHRKRRKVVVTP